MKPSRNILSFGINGSLRKREVQAQASYTEYYLFNSAANLKAYSNNGLDFAYYGYNASNTRAYKLSMLNMNQWVNGQPEPLSLQLQSAMFYPNAYINFNQNGEYTKHYYNGAERIASRLGSNTHPTDATSNDRLEYRMMRAEEKFRENIQELVSDGQPVDFQGTVELNSLQPVNVTSDIFYYHTNHLGSTAYVTDQNQNIPQGVLYAPFGEITTEYAPLWLNGTLPKYAFNAKELDEETGMYYYEARYYKPPVFTSRDPMMEQKPWLTPYHYCSNNPVGRVDISGNWDIEVHAYHDRKKSGYAVLIVKDRNGKEVYRTVVNTIGEGGRKRNVQYADTPQGKYKILEYRKTGDGTRYNREIYGPNDLLALNYEGEEGKGRNNMHLHGGRQEGKNKGRKNLANTRGCMRINDQDILEIQNITNDLEKNDSNETKGYLILTDDLKSHVDYSPNSSYRHKVAADQFPLPAPPLDLQIDPSLLKRMIVPIDNTRVALPNILR